MAPSPENIPHTLIIPPGSRERFVYFRSSKDAIRWFGNGVGLAGISNLLPGYLVNRPGCGHHFIAYVTRGKIWCRTDDAEIELSQGNLLFLRAGTLQHYEARRSLSMDWIHLDPKHSRWSYLAHRPSFHRQSRHMADLHDLMEQACTEAQSPLAHRDNVGESLCRLILAYVDRELEQDGTEGSLVVKERLEKVWREVNHDLAREWKIGTLARMAGMSPSHFHAIVNSVYRQSPMHIVRNLRLNHIQALLLNTNDTLEAIAERTGYQTAFSLSRAFKEFQGVSPRAFRKGQHKPPGHP